MSSSNLYRVLWTVNILSWLCMMSARGDIYVNHDAIECKAYDERIPDVIAIPQYTYISYNSIGSNDFK